MPSYVFFIFVCLFVCLFYFVVVVLFRNVVPLFICDLCMCYHHRGAFYSAHKTYFVPPFTD